MKFKLVFFDCDGVLTRKDTYRWVNDVIAKAGDEAIKWWNDYYMGRISVKKFTNKVLNFYRKHDITKKHLEKIIEKIDINPDAISIINHLKKRKIKITIISNSWDIFVKKIANILGIKLWRSGWITIFDKDGKYIGQKHPVQAPVQKIKITEIKRICKKFKIKPTDTMFVGDSINDIEPFRLTKHGVLYKRLGRPEDMELEKYAWKKIKHLSEIKSLL